LAGLTAAWRLRQAGYTVDVLEARDRVGGRVQTVSFGDGLHVDLGGEWVGWNHRHLRALARELDLSIADHKMDYRIVLEGREVPWEAVMPEALSARIAADHRGGPERLERLDAVTYLRRAGLDAAAIARLELVYAGEIGVPLRECSARQFVVDVRTIEDDDTYEDLALAAGSGALAEALAARLEGEFVHRNSPVVEIIRDRDAVQIRTADGVELRADRCIVALPLTMLRRIRFAPPLPAELEGARRQLPYARIAKFFLAFPRRTWPENMGVLTAEAGFIYHPTKGQRGPAGALGFYAGPPLSDQLARLTEPALVAQLLGAARGVLGRALPEPSAVLRRVWWAEDWSGGCWATYGPGQHDRFHAGLRVPHGRVHFAGEHTATEWPGFMEGAVESGERAAKEITG
jgi:monoamine oxidase